MKQTFLYLFIFSLLINIFLYVDSTKILNKYEVDIKDAKANLKIARDSIQTLNATANYFALENDLDARNELGIEDAAKFSIQLRDELVAKNDETAKGNPLITYAPVDGEKSIITKVKVLNNRWVIAEFYAGRSRGAVLIKYFINEGKPSDFEVINSILYS